MTTARDITIYQGQAFALSLDYAGTAGRGQRMHIRLADSTATVVQILTHNGDANARVLFDGTAALDITIGASVSAGWVVLADRVEWVYDIEDYDLADEDDCVIPYRGKVIVRGNRTRASDVTPSDQMPSGDGRYVRFDGVQGLTADQQLQARENIGAATGGGGGSGDVVGPASATDDRIAAFDGVTGKLIKQGGVTATAVASHLSSTSNPHSVTAAQAGADPTGTAAAAVVAHTGATDPHGDRAFATSAVSTHSALTTGAHGITAAGAALLDDADAAAQRTTLGLGTAALSATGDFEAAGAVSTHNAVTTAHGISAYGATLVDDADAATARSTLGLGTAATTAATDYATAGHNHSGVYQPADAELTAIAGLTSATDSAPYFTGSGTAALMTVTAAGRALIDDADASAQRTTLGLTALATTTPGTGVGTALGTNVGSAGAVVTNGGALGTPSSATLTNATGLPPAGITQSGATSNQVLAWNGSAWAPATPSAGSGDVVGPASATDNAIARFDTTTGKLVQDSGVTVSDVSGSSVTIASTAGNALAIAATAPAATTGASVAGKAASLTAAPAVASTDTAGAAAGGSVTITAGAAARLTSGNANGGNVVLTTGAGIGTGTAGQVSITGAGTAAVPAVAWASATGYGFYLESGVLVGVVAGGGVNMYWGASSTQVRRQVLFNSGSATNNVLAGNTRSVNAKTNGVGSPYSLAIDDSFKVFTNEGSSAKNYNSLITAAANIEYEFVVQDADGMRITAATGDTIRVMDKVTATGGYIESTTIGSVVRLVAINATEWIAMSIHGEWTDGTFTYSDTANTTP